MIQKERVLERLKNGDWLPMKETLRWSPPITRLGVRIFDLRAEGYRINISLLNLTQLPKSGLPT
jgi:hypothetical protein